GLVAFDTRAERHRYYTPDAKGSSSLPADTVWYIWEDDQGMLWLATWGAGLVRFDPQLEEFTAYTAAEGGGESASGITSNHLYTIYPDPSNEKLLWLGTAKGGLVRFNTADGSATAYRHRDDDPASLSSDDVTTIYRDPSGMIWAGT